MPKGKKTPIVDVGLDKTGSKNQTGSHQVTFKLAVTQNSSFSYVARRRIRSLLIKTVPSNGWRPPTAYRSAAVRRISFPFHLVNIAETSSIIVISGASRPFSGATYGYAPPDTLFFNSLGVPSVSTNLGIRATTEAMNKLRDAKIELGAMLAESRETVEFIRDTAEFLWQILLFAKSGRWDLIARKLNSSVTPKTAAEAWLAYSFAIQPLVANVGDALDAFTEKFKKQDAIIHVSRTVREDVTPLFVPTGNWIWASQSGRVEQLAKAVIYAKVSDSVKASLGTWGVTTPAAAIWEGLGWSFLVDWILPIGNFLNACGATMGLTFMGGSLTTRIHADLTYEVMPAVSGATMRGEPCKTAYRCLATDRVVFLDWPTPWPYIKSPLSSQHTSLVAALIVTGVKDFRFSTL